MGYQASNVDKLFRESAFNGSVGPSFQWNLLNYGRITGNIKLQDATFQELVVTYQKTVLQANQEVEDGIVTFLQAQRRARDLYEAVIAQAKAVDIAKARYLLGAGGESSFSTYTLYEQNLLTEQDTAAQARGQISQGLILVYRALGGGWEIRLGGAEGGTPPAPNPPEAIPTPQSAPNTATPPIPPPAPMPPAPRANTLISSCNGRAQPGFGHIHAFPELLAPGYCPVDSPPDRTTVLNYPIL